MSDQDQVSRRSLLRSLSISVTLAGAGFEVHARKDWHARSVSERDAVESETLTRQSRHRVSARNTLL